MSGIGSLGLDSTFVISCRGQSIVTGNGGTLESYYVDSPVLHQEASLQKICALLEKNEQPKSSSSLPVHQLRMHYYCTTTYDTTTTAVWSVRTANNAAIRARSTAVVPPLLYVCVPL